MYSFFAYLSRMRYITRWNLMRNTMPEDIAQHSLQVAMLAHGLAEIRKRVFGQPADPDRAALLAVYHESGETITGDLPTPIKYFSPEIRQAYAAVETVAEKRLLNMLPDVLKEDFVPLLHPEDEPMWPLVKAADRLSAYLKCVEELKAGNQEFEKAYSTIRRELEASPLPEVAYFMEQFEPAFHLTLDELN